MQLPLLSNKMNSWHPHLLLSSHYDQSNNKLNATLCTTSQVSIYRVLIMADIKCLANLLYKYIDLTISFQSPFPITNLHLIDQRVIFNQIFSTQFFFQYCHMVRWRDNIFFLYCGLNSDLYIVHECLKLYDLTSKDI